MVRQVSAHQSRQGALDREAESEQPRLGRFVVRRLIRLEDRLESVFWYASAVVDDPDHDVLSTRLCRYLYPLAAILHGVGEKVAQDLSGPRCVSAQPAIRTCDFDKPIGVQMR